MLPKDILNNIIKAILGPINESLSLLRKIDAKLDAQAISKLQGALASLQTVQALPRPDPTTLSIALASLNESAIYFRIMSEQTEELMDRKLSGTRAITKFISKSVRDLLGMRGGALDEVISMQLTLINYETLAILAIVGKLVCMAQLEYPTNHLEQEFNMLREMEIDIDMEREMVLPLARKRKILPKRIRKLSKKAFKKQFGAAMHPDDLEEIPVYEDDDWLERIFTRLFDQGGILYWLDDNTLERWAMAAFRYAALRTRITKSNSALNFLAGLAQGGRAQLMS